MKDKCEEMAKERVDFLLKSAQYVAGDAVRELYESHGGNWDEIRDRTIICLVVLLKHLIDRICYLESLKGKTGEIKLIIKALEELQLSDPKLKEQVEKPLYLVVNFKLE